MAFSLDTCDREIISWCAGTGAISGEMIRHLMLQSVEQRFRSTATPHLIQWTSDNGSCYRAHETIEFATRLGLVPCSTPLRSPQSNGMAEAFVKTYKRAYVRVSVCRTVESVLSQIAGWFEDHSENHPHWGLRMSHLVSSSVVIINPAACPVLWGQLHFVNDLYCVAVLGCAVRSLRGLATSCVISESIRKTDWSWKHNIMMIHSTSIRDLKVIEFRAIRDQRGHFARTFCAKEFRQQGLKAAIVQANLSFSHYKGTIRGMHFQIPPAAETKVIRCTRGSIVDIAVDLRPESSTFLKYFALELSEDNNTALYIPERFANGYQTLTEAAEAAYYTTEFYTPSHERGLRYDDPMLQLPWPTAPSTVSDKDRSWPLLDSDRIVAIRQELKM